MMELVVKYVLFFFIYSFIGWLLEVVCKIIEKRKFVNRGFLIGPICPIYGFGVLFIITLIGENQGDYLAIFLKSIFICSILEYMTSFLMEKLFKARWWDYSRRKFNINGRICLETMIPFGLLGLLVTCFVHPLINGIINIFDYRLQLIVACVLFAIYVVDNIISYIVMFKIKKEINDTEKDNTEYVRDAIYAWIDNNSWIYRRVKDAFPNFDPIGTMKKVEDLAVKTVLTINDGVEKVSVKTGNNIKAIKKQTKKNVKYIQKQTEKGVEYIKDTIKPTNKEYKKIKKEINKK